MRKKIEKFNIISNDTLEKMVELAYKPSYKRNWYIDSVTQKQNGDWIIHWKRKLGTL